MKKVILLGSVLVLGLVSCSKEYTCTCESIYDNPSFNTSETKVLPVSSMSEAITECSKRADEIKTKNIDFGIKDVRYNVTSE